MLGSLAALGATAVLATPTGIGPARTPSSSGLQLIRDPRTGVWLQYEGNQGAELVRINERGAVSVVRLPAGLRGQGLSFMPFGDGWGLAVATRFRGGAAEEQHCHEERIQECYGALAVAERSPAGRWTRVQTLPSSSGQTAGATAVESAGHFEIAWSADEEGPIEVAAAPLGRLFPRPHVAQRPLHGEPDHVSVTTQLGHLYIRAEWGPHGQCCSGAHVVERRIYPSGKLGPAHFLRSPLVRDQGTSLPAPGGSEIYVYEDGRWIGVARRRLWGSRYEHVRLLTKQGNGFSVSQSANDRTLVSFQTILGTEHSEINAVELSPAGTPGPARTVEYDPNNIAPGGYTWAAAIDDHGNALFATEDGGETLPSLWAHAYSPRCPGYSPRIPLAPQAQGEVSNLAAETGRHNVFHLAWMNAQHQIELTTGRVSCRQR